MSAIPNRQIFQTANPSRWQRFRWGSRFLIGIALLLILVLIVYIMRSRYPSVPLSEAYKKAITANKPLLQETKLAKEYKGFRQFITEKQAYSRAGRGSRQPAWQPTPNSRAATNWNQFPAGIRSAFYVAWDPQSFFSLKRCINKVNLVLPEWFFIDPKADTVFTSMDQRGFDLMKKNGVRIMPMLSNNFNGVFRPEAVSRIFHDATKRHKLISDVLQACIKNNFCGINVDLEEVQEEGDEPMILFMKELSDAFHAKGLLVTQDVSPFNEDYNYKELSQYNDYLFLMAYDEYSDSSDPGPISSQKWIEAAVDLVAKEIPSNKIILGIAGYGYDWSSTGKAEDITYEQALTTARESDTSPDFDNDTYNLHYSYADDSNKVHQVYFTDAATNFNTLRFATESSLAGTALWRLGSEDSRLWDFYNLDMRKAALQHFNFSEFNSVESSNDVDYMGEGEVLDVVSTPKSGRITPIIDTSEMLLSEERYDSLPSMFVVKRYGKAQPKQLVLTFDDGPDPTYTPQVLDILSKYHVPAAFFLVGINAEDNLPLVQRIYREGHEIGNHSFTHPNMAEVSPTRAKLEMKLTRLIIECITGHSTILFRAPYNADSEPESMEEMIPVANARLENYLDVGESIDPEDWQPGITADSIFQRVVNEVGLRDGRTILLHDAGGNDRTQTIKALPRIIEYFQKQGYTFISLSQLLHKPKDALMPPIPKGSGYGIMQANLLLVEMGYWGGHFLFSLFIVFLILSCIRLLAMAVMAIKEKRKSSLTTLSLTSRSPLQRQGDTPVQKAAQNASAGSPGLEHPNSFSAKNSSGPQMEKEIARLHRGTPSPLEREPEGEAAGAWGEAAPLVSIIVPAYNEEINAVRSLQNLLRQDYANFNVVFIDDGSKDSTYEKVKAAFEGHSKVQVFTKPNGGKASALNYGIAQTDAPYVVCIDADTQLKPDAVRLLMQHFSQPTKNDEPIGAVAGNVKVGNARNVLTRWQDIEYTTSQNFDRLAFAYINAITVVPGAIGAFSKKAIEEAGGFTTDTLAEDCDLTIRILRAGYRIENENRAVALTEAPEALNQFLKQRTRWSFGVMQTFWKHRDALFNKKYGTLGWIALPNILLFQFIIPIFSPLADIFMLIGIMSGNAARIGKYYLLFMLVDAAIAAMAFWFEKERLSKLVWLIPQRLGYRWIMYVVLFRSLKKAIKGELQHWGVLKRTGNVKMEEQLVKGPGIPV